MSSGIWRSSASLVEVTEARGKLLQSFGHMRDGVKFLHPEEALYLLERGTLRILHSGRALSIQDFYFLVSMKTDFGTASLDLDVYFAFLSLLESGCMAQRVGMCTSLPRVAEEHRSGTDSEEKLPSKSSGDISLSSEEAIADSDARRSRCGDGLTAVSSVYDVKFCVWTPGKRKLDSYRKQPPDFVLCVTRPHFHVDLAGFSTLCSQFSETPVRLAVVEGGRTFFVGGGNGSVELSSDAFRSTEAAQSNETDEACS